jgi:Gram-negative bacterial TonB protein C-terminal
MRPAVIALALIHVFAMPLPKVRKPLPPMPERFAIGRDTYFDFGPPLHYVELLLVSPAGDGDGTSIERVILTPGYECTLPPRIEVAKAAIKQSVAEIFGGTNPCKIPEKDLNRELKRRKHYLVFSGANISMQLQCDGQTRIIRSDILDRDMFDAHAGTPVHTSWTIGILARLDQALGPGVMDKPILPMLELRGNAEGTAPPDSATIQGIAAGEFDALFPGTSDKPSKIYLSTQKTIPVPTVRFLNSSPFQPISAPLPEYPPIARAASVEGAFTFAVDVQPDGRTTNFAVEQGAGLFRAAMENASHEWVFPQQAAGQRVMATVAFALNCHSP